MLVDALLTDKEIDTKIYFILSYLQIWHPYTGNPTLLPYNIYRSRIQECLLLTYCHICPQVIRRQERQHYYHICQQRIHRLDRKVYFTTIFTDKASVEKQVDFTTTFANIRRQEKLYFISLFVNRASTAGKSTLLSFLPIGHIGHPYTGKSTLLQH